MKTVRSPRLRPGYGSSLRRERESPFKSPISVSEEFGRPLPTSGLSHEEGYVSAPGFSQPLVSRGFAQVRAALRRISLRPFWERLCHARPPSAPEHPKQFRAVSSSFEQFRAVSSSFEQLRRLLARSCWFVSCMHEPMSRSRVKDEMNSCAKGVAAPDPGRYAGELTIEVHH